RAGVARREQGMRRDMPLLLGAASAFISLAFILIDTRYDPVRRLKLTVASGKIPAVTHLPAFNTERGTYADLPLLLFLGGGLKCESYRHALSASAGAVLAPPLGACGRSGASADQRGRGEAATRGQSGCQRRG